MVHVLGEVGNGCLGSSIHEHVDLEVIFCDTGLVDLVRSETVRFGIANKLTCVYILVELCVVGARCVIVDIEVRAAGKIICKSLWGEIYSSYRRADDLIVEQQSLRARVSRCIEIKCCRVFKEGNLKQT